MTSSPLEFDYVIVGGGSAGCVLAARLSEDPQVSVALLEAGGEVSLLRRPLLRVPAAFFLYTGPSSINWSFESEPEPFARGRRIAVPRGKVLGGSSAINGMMYQRGHPRDYDRWREAGLPGWGYADLLPYFRRAESSWRGEGPYHGGSGPVPVSLVDADEVGYEDLRQSAVGAGHADNDDHGRLPEGVGPTEMTVGHGRRADTASAYLRPARSRRNLTVISGAPATRILIEKGDAVGVEIRDRHGSRSIRAGREVILAGGVYGSPQLLLLSGIGPAAELAAHGIRVAVDLPGVGRNLGEHPFIFLCNQAHPPTFLSKLRFDRAVLSMLRWVVAGSGPFATNACRGSVFLRTRDELDRPDIQLLFPATRFDSAVWLPLVRARPEHRLDCGISLLHPESRGTVTLCSADPGVPPRILFNLCRAPADVEALAHGIRAARAIFAAEPLRSRVRGEVVPGPDCATDEQLREFVRANCAITHHAVGTCAMGTGAEAVVDASLRVRGIAGLRVVDASVMPEPPGGNCNMSVIMLAEKAADLIRGRELPPAKVELALG